MTALRLHVRATSAALRREIAKAPAQVADGFARVIRNSPEGRLEQILSTPVRRIVIEAIFWQMPQYFSRRSAAGMKATIRWRITTPEESGTGEDGSADVYELEIDDGLCRVRRGPSESKPRVTITLDAVEFVRLATGKSDPMQAYFKGRIKLGGDIMVAARMQSLFRIPGRRTAAQSVSTVSSSR